VGDIDDAYIDATRAARGRAAQFDGRDATGRALLAIDDETGEAKLAPNFGEQTVTARIGGFQLDLINDCLHTNIPIARFKVCSFVTTA
jgi:hypothetical protein